MNAPTAGVLTLASCGRALLPGPTLSYTYPEFWGTPGKKNQIDCGTPPPQGLSSPLSLSLSLSPCFIYCPISPGSWPTQPLPVSCSCPLLSIASPWSPHPPWLQPQAPHLSFQPEAPHFTKHGLPELRGTHTPTGPAPSPPLDRDTEAQREELTCLKRHCNAGMLDKLALGPRGSGRTREVSGGEQGLRSLAFRCGSPALRLRFLNREMERIWQTFSTGPGMRRVVVRGRRAAARLPGLNHSCTTWAACSASVPRFPCLCHGGNHSTYVLGLW